MQTIAPPQVSAQTIAAFFASMRLWLLETMAVFLAHLTDKTSSGRALHRWLDADVRDAIDDTRRMLFVMAVSRMAPSRVRAHMRGGALPSPAPAGFRSAGPRSRKWFRLTTRALKARGYGVQNRLALLRDLLARPEHWVARIGVRMARLKRGRKGRRFLCVAPPALGAPCNAFAVDATCADTS